MIQFIFKEKKTVAKLKPNIIDAMMGSSIVKCNLSECVFTLKCPTKEHMGYIFFYFPIYPWFC